MAPAFLRGARTNTRLKLIKNGFVLICKKKTTKKPYCPARTRLIEFGSAARVFYFVSTILYPRRYIIAKILLFLL